MQGAAINSLTTKSGQTAAFLRITFRKSGFQFVRTRRSGSRIMR
jgi:hypothetical protein